MCHDGGCVLLHVGNLYLLPFLLQQDGRFLYLYLVLLRRALDDYGVLRDILNRMFEHADADIQACDEPAALLEFLCEQGAVEGDELQGGHCRTAIVAAHLPAEVFGDVDH